MAQDNIILALLVLVVMLIIARVAKNQAHVQIVPKIIHYKQMVNVHAQVFQ